MIRGPRARAAALDLLEAVARGGEDAVEKAALLVERVLNDAVFAFAANTRELLRRSPALGLVGAVRLAEALIEDDDVHETETLSTAGRESPYE